MNAAIKIASEHRFKPEDIERVDTLVADMTRELVCEPAEAKRRPDSSYIAQFSLPYGMAACLTRKRFGLEEIEEPAYTEPAPARARARRCTTRSIRMPAFPRHAPAK